MQRLIGIWTTLLLHLALLNLNSKCSAAALQDAIPCINSAGWETNPGNTYIAAASAFGSVHCRLCSKSFHLQSARRMESRSRGKLGKWLHRQEPAQSVTAAALDSLTYICTQPASSPQQADQLCKAQPATGCPDLSGNSSIHPLLSITANIIPGFGCTRHL